ncbi:MAG: hypothetical protein ABMB14_25185, partial [Myxococcota bacterium]
MSWVWVWLALDAGAVEDRWVALEPALATGDPWPGAAARTVATATPWAVLPDGPVLAQAVDADGGVGW